MDGTDFAKNPVTPSIYLYRQVARPMTSTKWPSPWPARTLIVAAWKRGILPSNDHPKDAVRLMEIGREENAATVAVTHFEMRHPWNRQAPELFAKTACFWFENREIPHGFKKL
jgi:hypothetical protein